MSEYILNGLLQRTVSWENDQWNSFFIRFYDPDGHLIEVGEPMNFDSLAGV